MAMIWKTRTMPLAECDELGSGTWEPFFVVEEDGQALVVCKGMFDDSLDQPTEANKASEVTGGLGDKW